ncbi:sialidase family protein [Mucilaginibacter pedocola]|uniref:Sialidase domain-containing protein n=1 Tax=Mucilaginibacter pedocola TaxID=1792845 RepID=A0A1S9PEY0_9SPHI|nr:sialidase family protein [Mucilaginibacter pedocola]OOQ59515.1 hypothetical protein BC343_04885 [Mucilaginibacter pedocola]
MQIIKHAMLLLLLLASTVCFAQQQAADTIRWNQRVLINDQPLVNDTSAGSVQRNRSKYGSEYCRLLQLKDGSWLAGYTISRNAGYKADAKGGLELQVSRSTDNCRSWVPLGTISEPGRDLDNAQLIQLKDGSLLLACRSVRWQESYKLVVYKSTDMGVLWKPVSIIDENHGQPGELGKPDKGIYEPHMYLLNDGRLSVMYANEKHVVEKPSYSQIISQKISNDLGKTWGTEIWVAHTPGNPASRPGMPVWTKMKNGKYIVVYEVCSPEECHIYYKYSDDGINWPVGLGTRIMDQLGGPFVLSLADGTLVVTSNSSHVSISRDYGQSWQTINNSWAKTLWPSLYEVKPGEVAAVSSEPRAEGGHNVQLRLGIMPKR